MKFIIKSLILLTTVTSFVLSKNFKRNDLCKINFSISDSGIEKLSKECVDAINVECPIEYEFNNNNIEEICNKYNAKRSNCKKIFEVEEDFSFVNACKNEDKKYLEKIFEKHEFLNSNYETICIVDESGKLCPNLGFSLCNENSPSGKDDSMKYVNASCSSKICYDAIYKNAELQMELNEDDEKEVEYYKKVLDYLKTDECKSQRNQKISNAITVKYNTGLIITISVLLSLFL
ncbi:hypothetical protein U3516DRAFT_651188 [Neocallimastix sp. 'constans']